MISLLTKFADYLFEDPSEIKDEHSAVEHRTTLTSVLEPKALLQAATMGDLKEVRSLLERVNPNIEDSEGNTPLHLAIKSCSLPVILALAEKGAKIDDKARRLAQNNVLLRAVVKQELSQ